MTEKIYAGIDNERFEATDELLQEILTFQIEHKAEMDAKKAEAQAKAEAKAALLAQLGITEEQAKLLLS